MPMKTNRAAPCRAVKAMVLSLKEAVLSGTSGRSSRCSPLLGGRSIANGLPCSQNYNSTTYPTQPIILHRQSKYRPTHQLGAGFHRLMLLLAFAQGPRMSKYCVCVANVLVDSNVPNKSLFARLMCTVTDACPIAGGSDASNVTPSTLVFLLPSRPSQPQVSIGDL